MDAESAIELGQLTKCDPRAAWPDEARQFTPWLAKNLDRLGEALGLELELQGVEAPVGGFALDILARDLGRDRVVIIENQLSPTDHDHLGKVITYASGYDAAVVIWIAPDIREEHRQALDWLNSRTDSETEFFGVQLELFRIDESRPAVQFNPVAAPNTWRKERIRGASALPTERGEAYRGFFQALLDELRERHSFTRGRTASPQNWYSVSAGITGVQYVASFPQGGRCRAEVYIDLRDDAANKAVFDRLFSQKEAIEAVFLEPLSWERLDSRRACRIAVYRDGSIDDADELLTEIRGWLIERLLRLKTVFGGRLQTAVSDLPD